MSFCPSVFRQSTRSIGNPPAAHALSLTALDNLSGPCSLSLTGLDNLNKKGSVQKLHQRERINYGATICNGLGRSHPCLVSENSTSGHPTYMEGSQPHSRTDAGETPKNKTLGSADVWDLFSVKTRLD